MRGFAAALGLLLAACVSDPAPFDAGPDSGTSSDTGSAVACLKVAPMLFAPVPNQGPFCSMAAPGNHCPLGQHCCSNVPANTRTCTTSCAAGAGVIDIGCLNPAECPMGNSCCGDGVVKPNLCAYPIVGNLTRLACQPMPCAGYTACATTADCPNGKTCTAAYAIGTDNVTVYPVHLGTCL